MKRNKLHKINRLQNQRMIPMDANKCRWRKQHLYGEDREEDKNTSRVVVLNETPSRGLKRPHDSDNSDFDKESTHHLNLNSHTNHDHLISKLPLVTMEPSLGGWHERRNGKDARLRTIFQ
jgi:hypothetical protein